MSGFQAEEWNVDRVCSWLDAVAAVQNSGKSAHPDDLRTGIYFYNTALTIYNILTMYMYNLCCT